MERTEIAEFIQALRKEKGLTQKQLAELLGVTDKAVSKWERGQGYPDVASLPKLAETLGVTVGELLDGKHAEISAPQTDELVENALHYAQKVTVAKHKNIGRGILLIISCLFIIAAFTCVICDVAIFKGLTWSLYPIASMAYAWLILFPLCTLPKNKLMGGLAAASVFIFPFLFCLERMGDVRWFFPLAMPIALASVAYLWIGWWLFCKKKGIWFAGALMVALSLPLDLYIDYLAGRFAGEFIWGLDSLIQCAATAAVTLLFLVIGCYYRKKNR